MKLVDLSNRSKICEITAGGMTVYIKHSLCYCTYCGKSIYPNDYNARLKQAYYNTWDVIHEHSDEIDGDIIFCKKCFCEHSKQSLINSINKHKLVRVSLVISNHMNFRDYYLYNIKVIDLERRVYKIKPQDGTVITPAIKYRH